MASKTRRNAGPAAIITGIVDNAMQHPMAPQRWTHRRRLAYMAMVSMLIVTGSLLTDFIAIERIEALSGMIEWFYVSMASIVGTYMGLSTWLSKATDNQMVITESDGTNPRITN